MKTMILVALVLLVPFAAAQYGSSSSAGNPLAERGQAVNDRFMFTSNPALTELKGVWLNTGRQQSFAAVEATENGTMPDCSMDTGLSAYTGLDYGSSQFYVLAGSGSVNSIVVNGQRTNMAPNVTYNGSIIVAMRNGAPSCTHFMPYIDLTTGELKAQSISITQWTINATSGSPSRTNLNCEVTGMEMPGCYSGMVSTAPAMATTPSVSVSSIGAPAPRPEGAIRTVTSNIWTCQQGECLRLNPKYSSTSPAYGCN